MTGRVVQEKMRSQAEWVCFESGQDFEWEGFQIGTFALPHDAVEPVGYVISKNDLSVGVATDLGHANAGVMRALQAVDGMVLEANYEWRLLEADLKRPFSTKQRISSKHGHLSNEQAGEILAELEKRESGKLQRVVLTHLSSDCNTAEVATQVVGERAGRQVEICCAGQDVVTAWQEVVQVKGGVGEDAEFGELFAWRL